MSAKLDGYFGLPSLAHYLILSASVRRVIHHSRGEAGQIATRIHHDGSIDLQPPGLRIEVEELYFETDVAENRR